MSAAILLFAVGFLAYANGANDNFKGVASLFGSRTCAYQTAIAWATATTFAGSICAIFLAQTLLAAFSGKGLVPAAIVATPHFLLAVALGAALTVMLATLTGFPISTTHSLTGAIVGSGLVAVGVNLDFSRLGHVFFLPLLLSPVLAVGLGAVLYFSLRTLRLSLGITKDTCVCLGTEAVPLVPAITLSVPAETRLSLRVDSEAQCTQRYVGNFFGINCQRLVDIAHFLSAGVVSFARGLNDTPKMAALLLIVPGLSRWDMVLVAIAIAAGGLLSAQRVAETMSHRITAMNHGQGFSANLATGLLVIAASGFGLPVSTTHVSVGALSGIGLITRQARLGVLGQILLSWVLTLPCAALLAALIYWLTKPFITI